MGFQMDTAQCSLIDVELGGTENVIRLRSRTQYLIDSTYGSAARAALNAMGTKSKRFIQN